MSDYTEADLDRDLGITSWDEYDKALKGITEAGSTDDPAWAEFDAELARIKEGRTVQTDLLDAALGINVTEAEREDAMRQLTAETSVRESDPVSERRAYARRARPEDEARLANGRTVRISELGQARQDRAGHVTVSEHGSARLKR